MVEKTAADVHITPVSVPIYLDGKLKYSKETDKWSFRRIEDLFQNHLLEQYSLLRFLSIGNGV